MVIRSIFPDFIPLYAVITAEEARLKGYTPITYPYLKREMIMLNSAVKLLERDKIEYKLVNRRNSYGIEIWRKKEEVKTGKYL